MLGLLTSLILLTLGCAVLVVAVRGVRRGTTPHCPECDYNLTGLTAGRCPECGLALDGTSPRFGEKRYRTHLACIGIVIVLMASPGAFRAARTIPWIQFYPLPLVERMAQSGHTDGMTELLRRCKNWELTERQAIAMADVCLNQQVTRTRAVIPWLELFNELEAAYPLRYEQRMLFFTQATGKIEIVPTQQIWSGEPIRGILTYDRYPGGVNFIEVGPMSARFEGNLVQSELRCSGRKDAPYRIECSFEMPLAPEFGAHTIDFHVAISLRRRGFSRTPTIWRYDAQLQYTVEVVDPDGHVPSVFRVDTEAEDRLTDLIHVDLDRLCGFGDMGYDPCEFWEPWVDVWLSDPTPVSLAFDVRLRSGIDDVSIGHWYCRQGTARPIQDIEIPWGLGIESPVAVLLIASRSVARKAPDLGAILDADFVFEDLRFPTTTGVRRPYPPISCPSCRTHFVGLTVPRCPLCRVDLWDEAYAAIERHLNSVRRRHTELGADD